MLNVTMLAPGKARVQIYDLIGPSAIGMIDAKTVSDKLAKAGHLSEIELRINSKGGDAFEGLAITRILMAHSAKKTGIVDGLAASAATLPLCACDTVRIPANGLLMIHGPRKSTFMGTEVDHRVTADTLRAVTTAVVQTYTGKSRQSPAQIETWMAAETWFVGQQAVDAGFADELIGDVSMVESRADVQQVYQQSAGFVALSALALDPERFAQDSVFMGEYQRDRRMFELHGISQVEFIASCRVTAGLEPLLTKAP